MINYKKALIITSVPVAFGVGFTKLSSLFDYPKILRQPTTTVLDKFVQVEHDIMPWWWLMFVAALVFVPVSLAIGTWIPTRGVAKNLTLGVGVAAGLVQAIGLSRWVFAVPVLATHWRKAGSSESGLLLFEILNNWIGGGIGEFSGYMMTSLWTFLVASVYRKSNPWFTGIGFAVSIGIAVGMTETFGVRYAGIANALSYTIWILWMLALAWLVSRSESLNNKQ